MYLIQCQELMKNTIQNGMKLVNVNVNQMQVFEIIRNFGIMINAELVDKGRCDKNLCNEK